ncbi:MAG: hypothetical protein WCK31_02970 [bacterium]
MPKNKSSKAKTVNNNTKKTAPIKDDDDAPIVNTSEDFTDASDDLEDSDDLTSTFAKRKALAEDDSWDVVSTDEDDDVLTIKSLSNDLTDEEQLDAVISDYAGIDGLAPEKSNKED